jgi:hypothetical protein
MKVRLTFIGLLLAIALVICGCETADKSLWDQISELDSEKSQLRQRVDSLETENTALKERMHTLTAIGADKRAAAMTSAQKISLEKRTGLADKDNDGVKETLVVYLRPYDASGDAIKAAGAVNLQLWDLDAAPKEAMLREWQITPDELKGMWSGTMLTSYYRIANNIADLLGKERKNLTVKITFTDYVTGKILSEQKLIK